MAQEGTVHVLALFTAAPGKEEELERVLTALIEPTRKEAGCIRYDLVRGLVELLARLDPVLPPDLGGKDDPTLGGDGGLHAGQISSDRAPAGRLE